jgi:hypothetical protein
MGKRREYLQPGVRFRRECWQDLNHVERRRFLARGTVPARVLMAHMNRVLQEVYTVDVFRALVRSPSPFMSRVLP